MAARLETFLLEDDIAARVDLHCLSCRARLGAVRGPRRKGDDGRDAISVVLEAEAVRDVQQAPGRLIVVCSCEHESTFHLLY